MSDIAHVTVGGKMITFGTDAEAISAYAKLFNALRFAIREGVPVLHRFGSASEGCIVVTLSPGTQLSLWAPSTDVTDDVFRDAGLNLDVVPGDGGGAGA